MNSDSRDHRINKERFLSNIKETDLDYTSRINSRVVTNEEMIEFVERSTSRTPQYIEGDRVIAGKIYHFSNLFFGDDKVQIKSLHFFASSIHKDGNKRDTEIPRDEVVRIIAECCGFKFKDMMADVHIALRSKDMSILEKYGIKYSRHCLEQLEIYKNNDEPYKCSEMINKKIRDKLKEVMEDD